MKRTSVLLVLVLGFQLSGLFAQHANNQEFTFVFMTDIHVQTELQADKGLSQAIEKVNALNPDFVITGGDLIMDALGQTKDRADSLYTLYLDLQKQFNMPVYNTPGNHEYYGFYKKEEVERTDPDYGINMYRRYLGKPYYSFDHKGWHFIVLNSIVETEERGYRGGVSEEQLSWLEKDLNAVDANTPIAVSVHIPMISAMAQMNKGSLATNLKGSVINNSKEVLAKFSDKNLRLVLQGHLHYLEDLNMGGKVHFITGGAVSSSWWRGTRYGIEEGFLLVKVKGDQFTWEYIDYGWEPVKDR